MDQAQDQPACTSTVAPAHTVATATTRDAQTQREMCIAHTSQPDQGFWVKTMEPAVFWTAASALSTLLAVVVAFVLPGHTDRRHQRMRKIRASHLLLPLFNEIRTFAEEAKWCNDRARSMEHGLRDTAQGSPGLEWHHIQGVSVSDDSARRLRAIAEAQFPTYSKDRALVSDLDPRTAGKIHSELDDILRLVSELRAEVATWRSAPYITPDELRRYWGTAGSLATAAAGTANRLASVVGQPKMQLPSA